MLYQKQTTLKAEPKRANEFDTGAERLRFI